MWRGLIQSENLAELNLLERASLGAGGHTFRRMENFLLGDF